MKCGEICLVCDSPSSKGFLQTPTRSPCTFTVTDSSTVRGCSARVLKVSGAAGVSSSVRLRFFVLIKSQADF